MSSAEAAYAALREGIVSGQHAGGARLEEETLAAALGVSRTPVREALRRLHAEGLVQVEPRRGARVSTWGAEELDEIFELRALVEGYGAARAATRVTEAQLAQLEDLCEAMEEAACAPGGADHALIGRLNNELHAAVHRAASSRYVAGLLTSLVQIPLVVRTFQRYQPEELARSMGHHRELVAALRAGRPEWAEAVMHAHVEAARATLRRDLGAEPAGEPAAMER
ncbi:MAG: GntR family transcriptional regulator [Actinomycetota bacterium]|nr:GntR family transcriptional regulator [Actinomycetota bacterium]